MQEIAGTPLYLFAFLEPYFFLAKQSANNLLGAVKPSSLEPRIFQTPGPPSEPNFTAAELEGPREACGVYGIFGSPQAAHYVYLGLYSLQHRGQESAGIVSTNGESLYRYANMGRVSGVFSRSKLAALQGHAAIGHNRYSTTGASFLRNAQPIRVESRLGAFALAHNGNLINSQQLRQELEGKGSIFQTTVDTEVIVHLMSISRESNFMNSLCEALRQIKGAYSLILLARDSLYAVRDPNGFRPLVLGKRKDGAHVVASETCAFSITETDYIRDVEPGELLCIDQQGLRSYYPFEKSKPSLCIFENIYFSRPDSIIFGNSVYEVRKHLGRYLAKEFPVKADVVVPVPDSSNVAALGYAEESKIPYTIGLIRSHYIGRTFIEPNQKIRDFGARIKYNVVQAAVHNKRVVLVDDSIMRGTTARKLVKIFREAGVKELHLRISAPPTRYPCFYGVDIPTKEELIASSTSIEEITKNLDVDSLGYMSLEAAHKAMQNGKEQHWCDACFSGKYPLKPSVLEGEARQKELFTDLLADDMT